MKDIKAIAFVVVTVGVILFALCSATGYVRRIRIPIVEEFIESAEAYHLDREILDGNAEVESLIESVQFNSQPSPPCLVETSLSLSR